MVDLLTMSRSWDDGFGPFLGSLTIHLAHLRAVNNSRKNRSYFRLLSVRSVFIFLNKTFYVCFDNRDVGCCLEEHQTNQDTRVHIVEGRYKDWYDNRSKPVNWLFLYFVLDCVGALYIYAFCLRLCQIYIWNDDPCELGFANTVMKMFSYEVMVIC